MNDIVRPTGLVGPRPLGERPLPPTARGSSHTAARAVQTSLRRRRLPGGGADADGLRRASSAGRRRSSPPTGSPSSTSFSSSPSPRARPWTVLGVVNAGIGFLLARLSKAPLDADRALRRRGRRRDAGHEPGRRVHRPCATRTPPRAVSAGSRWCARATSRPARAPRYGYFVLSDTSRPPGLPRRRSGDRPLARAGRPGARILYRRRPENVGYKQATCATSSRRSAPAST